MLPMGYIARARRSAEQKYGNKQNVECESASGSASRETGNADRFPLASIQLPTQRGSPDWGFRPAGKPWNTVEAELR